MSKKLLKIISILLCFLLCFQQSGLAQVAGQLDISSYFAGLQSSLTQEKFRPLHLRYLAYDNLQNNFKLLLDKGDAFANSTNSTNATIATNIEQATQELLRYFFVGVSLPNESFWVNLRPDSPDNIIDDWLAQTDVGKVLLEADLQLKKDTAQATSPQTPEGKKYWDKLYKKAEELFGSENITIPTLTRPWIVPGEIIIRESSDNAYIYKATLKVMLEEDYLRGTRDEGRWTTTDYSFKDPRLKALNEYSSQLIRELIIPKLTKEVNSSKRYAPLRQVYYSLILAQWFKARFYGKGGLYSWLIDKKALRGLTSASAWHKNTYFKAYQSSFKDGEYNLKEPTQTPYGQSVRNYFSGGVAINLGQIGSSPAKAGEIVKSGSIEFIRGNPNRSLGLVSSPLVTNGKEIVAIAIGSQTPGDITDIKLAIQPEETRVASSVKQPAAASPAQSVSSAVTDIYSSHYLINTNAFRTLLAQAVPERLRGQMQPVLKGSVVYFADANGNVNDSLIGDIDIAFETKGASLVGTERREFAERLRGLLQGVVGEANVGPMQSWDSREHGLEPDMFHEFVITTRSFRLLKISITISVGRDIAGDMIDRELRDILIEGPRDRFGLINDYDKAVKRYLLVLRYLDEERFRQFQEQYSIIVHRAQSNAEETQFLSQLLSNIETVIQAHKKEYLARIAPDSAELPALKETVRRSLYGQQSASSPTTQPTGAASPAQANNQNLPLCFVRELFGRYSIGTPLGAGLRDGNDFNAWSFATIDQKEWQQLFSNIILTAKTEDQFINEVIPALVEYIYRHYQNNGYAAIRTAGLNRVLSAYQGRWHDAQSGAQYPFKYTPEQVAHTLINTLLSHLDRDYSEHIQPILDPYGYLKLADISRRQGIVEALEEVAFIYGADQFKDFLIHQAPLQIQQVMQDFIQNKWDPRKQYHTELAYVILAVYRSKSAAIPALNIESRKALDFWRYTEGLRKSYDYSRGMFLGPEYTQLNMYLGYWVSSPIMQPKATTFSPAAKTPGAASPAADFTDSEKRLMKAMIFAMRGDFKKATDIMIDPRPFEEQGYLLDAQMAQEYLSYYKQVKYPDGSTAFISKRGELIGFVSHNAGQEKVAEFRLAILSLGRKYDDLVNLATAKQKIKSIKTRMLFKKSQEIKYTGPIKLTFNPGPTGSLTLWIYKLEDIPDHWPVKRDLNPFVGYFIIKESGPENELKGLRDGEHVILGRWHPSRFMGFDNKFISREHVEISRQADTIFIEDTSSNGTLVGWVEEREASVYEPDSAEAKDNALKKVLLTNLQTVRDNINRTQLPCTNGRRDLVLLNGKIADERLDEIQNMLLNGTVSEESIVQLKIELEQINGEVERILSLFKRFSVLDYRQRLGLTANAANDEIKKNYRKLMAEFHPDRYENGNGPHPISKTVSVEIAKLINEAYVAMSSSPIASAGSPEAKPGAASPVAAQNAGAASPGQARPTATIDTNMAAPALEPNIVNPRAVLSEEKKAVSSPVSVYYTDMEFNYFHFTKTEKGDSWYLPLGVVDLVVYPKREEGNTWVYDGASYLEDTATHVRTKVVDRERPKDTLWVYNENGEVIIRIGRPAIAPEYFPDYIENCGFKLIPKEDVRVRSYEYTFRNGSIIEVLLVRNRMNDPFVYLFHRPSESAQKEPIALASVDVYDGNVVIRPDYYDEMRFPLKKTTSGSPVQKPGAASPAASDKGGVDFRALPIVTQPPVTGYPVNRLSGYPVASSSVNLDESWKQIQNMLNAGIIPSSERIREYLAACCQREDSDKEIDKVLACIADILRLEEERCQATDSALKEMLVLLESDRPASQIPVALSSIMAMPKEPALTP